MPSLHETYATLLRRGMPEHPRLRYNSQQRWGTGTYWGYYDGDEPLMAADEADARDLLTMHALRWWYTTEHLDWEGALLRRGHIVMDEARVRLCRDGGGVVGEGPTILDAIVVATKHLEPQGE